MNLNALLVLRLEVWVLQFSFFVQTSQHVSTLWSHSLEYYYTVLSVVAQVTFLTWITSLDTFHSGKVLKC